MIFFFSIPPWITYTIIGGFLVMLVVASGGHVIQQTIENIPDWLERSEDHTTSYKFGLLMLVALTLGGAAGLVYGWVENDGLWATVSIILIMAAGLGCTMLGSPMELVSAADNAGCIGSLFVLPATLLSFTAAILLGWIFTVVSIFRGSTWTVRIITLLVVALLICLIPAAPLMHLYQEYQMELHEENQNQLDQNTLYQITQRVEEFVFTSELSILELSSEETEALKRLGYNSVWSVPACVEAVAGRFYTLYLARDFDGVLDFIDLLVVNKCNCISNTRNSVSVWFDDEFLTFMRSEAAVRGTYLDDPRNSVAYQYGDRVLCFSETWMLADWDVTLDVQTYEVYEMLGTEAYRKSSCETYDEPYRDYYLVGEAFTFHEGE